MKILILGATGLLGSSLKSVLDKDHNHLLIPSRQVLDLTISNDIEQYLRVCKPDIIINCAARVGGLYSQIRLPASYLHDNLIITDCIFEAVKNASPSSFLINFLSTCCFPASVSYPITPEQLHMGPPHHTNSSYSYAKRMIDIYAQSYYSEFGISSALFILGNLFGPHDNFGDPENAHVIPSLISKAHAARKAGNKSYEIYGDGKPLREFLYVEDASKCISLYLSTIESGQEPEVLLFSNPNEVSILNLATLIGKIVSPSNPLTVTTSSESEQGQLKKPSDTSAKLQKLFGNEDFTPLEESLRTVYKSYIDYYTD